MHQPIIHSLYYQPPAVAAVATVVKGVRMRARVVMAATVGTVTLAWEQMRQEQMEQEVEEGEGERQEGCVPLAVILLCSPLLLC